MVAVVVVYYWRGSYPLRLATSDHLLSLARHCRRPTIYLNAAYPLPASLLKGLSLSAVIFHTSFLSVRWSLPAFARVRRRVKCLRGLSGTRILLPQDEFLNGDALCEFIAEAGADHICTTAAERDLPLIYRHLPAANRPQFHRVLTGYLEEKNLRPPPRGPRRIDVGYRAWQAAWWLGSMGRHKVRIATETGAIATELGLTADISLGAGDTLPGGQWLDFLERTTAVVGCEGGASICDHDGSLRAAVESYIKTNPSAAYEEVFERFLKSRDGELTLHCLSPRHFEAAMTGTYQILIEGDYNGVLQAGVHYYPVKPDYSNLREALLSIRDEPLRRRITDAATRDLIDSGRYTYRAWVSWLETLIPGKPGTPQPIRIAILRIHHNLLWQFMKIEALCMQFLNRSAAGRQLVQRIRGWVAGR